MLWNIFTENLHLKVKDIKKTRVKILMEEYNILAREKNSISKKIKLLFLEITDIFIHRAEIELICIKPDTPINVYTRFCLNTAKSKFSLVSPVAG